jgi:dihydrolipoamide dehydrogenase
MCKTKQYDLIAIGSGSAMMVVQAFVDMHPRARVAVIDKDPPGGICLTTGCVPTKLLVYPAEVLRIVEDARELGVRADNLQIDFRAVMQRMRTAIASEVDGIRTALKNAANIDYFAEAASFSGPYRLRVGAHALTSRLILLGTGSRPAMPAIENLARVPYHTSDTILTLDNRPKRLTIVGGGYIAAEFGHFFAAAGSAVTIVGRNPRLLPAEEPEVSALAHRKLARHMNIHTGHTVVSVSQVKDGVIHAVIRDRQSGREKVCAAEALLVATGRVANTDILSPEKAGIQTSADGWIETDDYLQTTQPGIWALGDATGRHQFKHVANYEAQLVYENALLQRSVKADYRAVPHAVFTYPEVAAVGLGESQAVAAYGEDEIIIGFESYANTTKGHAMGIAECFVKLVLRRDRMRILGAHIIGPQASVMIQEIVNLMVAGEGSVAPLVEAMHTHPALSEVVSRAALNTMPRAQYRRQRAER